MSELKYAAECEFPEPAEDPPAKSRQSFVVKTTDGRPVGQLTIFWTGARCTGGKIHLNQGTAAEERYDVFLKRAR